jgi:hypothetical protein
MKKLSSYFMPLLMLGASFCTTTCCNDDDAQEIITDIAGTTWKLQGHLKADRVFQWVIPLNEVEDYYTISFNPNGTITGKTYTHSFQGIYKVSGDKIQIQLEGIRYGNLYNGTTLESLLETCSQFKRDDNSLELIVNRGEEKMLFIKSNGGCPIEDDNMHPIFDVDENTASFFVNALQQIHGIPSENFFTNIGELEEVCYVVNNEEQLKALYNGKEKLPDIDFTKYTLVIGKTILSDTGETIARHYISNRNNPTKLTLRIYDSMEGLAVVSATGYWGLYPKFESNTLEIKKRICELDWK